MYLISLTETEGVDEIQREAEPKILTGLRDLGWFFDCHHEFSARTVAVNAGLYIGFAAAVISILDIGAVVYLGTRIAATEATSRTTVMCAPFGIRGRVIPSLAVVLATVGWFGIQTGIIVASSQEVLANWAY